MDKTTKILFGRTPREIATPKRWVINNLKELQVFISNNNGVHDCFTSVYPSNYLIDKIFNDFDYSFVLEDAQKYYAWCLDNNYQAIPIVSGKKGYHIYFITHPKLYGKETKLLLTKATFSILKEVFGNFKQETVVMRGKEVRILRTKDRIIAPDPTVIGDVRRITRIPNTLRPPENLNYCTYLPPRDFLDMDSLDVVKHMKKTHSYDYDIQFRKAPYLTDFEYDFDEEPDYRSWTPILGDKKEVITSNPSMFLQGLLRPCLYRHLTTIHPSHDVRTASTIDLLRAGYSPTEILSVYSTLGWEDFEEKYSLEQIESCQKYKQAYSCTKLRRLGIPIACCVG